MSKDPLVFQEALSKFMSKVFQKAITRAQEKNRPTDPWNEYEQEFIRGRLVEEIGEFLEKFLKFDASEKDQVTMDEEDSELYDICSLACSLWMAKQV